MQLPMMAAAERDSELIADFKTQSARLREAQMVRVARMPTANKARLGSHKAQMGFVAPTFGLG